jgi:long-chain fatty acid transport protein
VDAFSQPATTMRNQSLFRRSATCLLAILSTSPLVATNGMNLEGYGPVATAMGGASLAFDNGTAAVINNPATLGLLPSDHQFDLALGVLGPRITATSPAGAAAESQSKAFCHARDGLRRPLRLPHLRTGAFRPGRHGLPNTKGQSWRGLGYNLENATEVSVGRLIAPLSWRINERLHVAATADFIWAGMDLKMAMSGAQFFDLVDPRSQQFGRASGSLVQSFSGMLATLPAGTNVDYAYFNFANGNPFTGEARGYGYAGKVGMVYELTPQLTVGATYHSRTRLGDLKAPGNSLSFQLGVPGMGSMAQSLAGDFVVQDFEWPAIAGLGFAFRPNSTWLLVADFRTVFWQDVMDRFAMRFTASGAASNGPFANQVLDATLFQHWDNQHIFQVGASVRATRRSRCALAPTTRATRFRTGS